MNSKNTRYGQIIFNPNDTRVGKHLMQYSEYAEGQARLLRKLTGRKDWIVEIGAGYGCHTLMFASIAKEGVVMAVEPSRMPYYCLCGSIALNGYENVYCRQEFVGYKQGRMKIPEYNQNMPQDFCETTQIPSGVNACTIKMNRLDAMFEKIDLLKISTGHACEIIEGGQEILHRCKPFIYITTKDYRLAIPQLRLLGYDVYAHMPREYNNDNFADNQFNTIGNMAEQNLFAMHPENSRELELEYFDLCLLEDGDEFEEVGLSVTEKLQRIEKDVENSVLKMATLCSEELHDHKKAQDILDASFSLLSKPSVAVMRSKGAVATKVHDWKKASFWFKQGLEKADDSEKYRLYTDYGISQYAQCNYEEAIEAHEKAYAIRKTSESAWQLALAYLKVGNYEKGWPLYETRLNHPRSQMWLNAWSGVKYWNGEPLEGKSIVLFNEQGAGDFIQTMRYLPVLRQTAERVDVVVDKNLAGLVKSMADIVIPCSHNRPTAKMPQVDYVCSMFSLPRILGVPGPNEPLTFPHIDFQEEYKLPSPSVGVVWAGSPHNENDFLRSTHLKNMKPIFEQRAAVYSLQQDAPERIWTDQGKVDLLEGTFDTWFVSKPKFKTFKDTAKFIHDLDYVVGVDTAVTHLAAAMDKPVFLALGLGDDWRWGTEDRVDWYPSVRIYRRTVNNSWRDVFDNIASDLKDAIKEADQKKD